MPLSTSRSRPGRDADHGEGLAAVDRGARLGERLGAHRHARPRRSHPASARCCGSARSGRCRRPRSGSCAGSGRGRAAGNRCRRSAAPRTSRMKAPRIASTRRHSAAKAPPMPRGAAGRRRLRSRRGAGRALLRSRAGEGTRAACRARQAPPARRKGRAESASGSPRAACPSSTAMYQRKRQDRAPDLRESVHAQDRKSHARRSRMRARPRGR